MDQPQAGLCPDSAGAGLRPSTASHPSLLWPLAWKEVLGLRINGTTVVNVSNVKSPCVLVMRPPAVQSRNTVLGPVRTCESFQGSQGRAYLFNSVVNVGCGPAEERVLLTGLHAVADIYCENCKTTLGWKYEHAFESSQKYKEGKFIIELAHMIKDNGWE
ncbi:hypothetical protein E5288_WYG019091 [Bos mutus]|uniref:Protein yippee-like n=1 Tax=Bos mutus TaxID=72004 RepID=A0A6B0SFH0_9CETA|nr:hypothetical protein [Bos mutus]